MTKTTRRFSDSRVLGAASLTLALMIPGTAQGAGPDPEQFGDYKPAHTVIKCPYIPKGVQKVPLCGGKSVTCMGTDGHDLILGSEEQDVIFAGPGNDIVHGDAGDDIICGGPGMDSLFGARGDDRIYGGADSDWLFGAPGADELYGGPGDSDALWGGPGYDVLDGGPGTHDVCLQQRELAKYNEETCNTVYPPPGYIHEQEPEPGLLKRPAS